MGYLTKFTEGKVFRLKVSQIKNLEPFNAHSLGMRSEGQLWSSVVYQCKQAI